MFCYSTSLPSRNCYQIQRSIEVPVKRLRRMFYKNQKQLAIFAKRFTIDVWQGAKHASKNNPGNIYSFKVTNRNIRKRCELCSKLNIKTPVVFTVNFEYISHLFVVFLLVILNEWSLAGKVRYCKYINYDKTKASASDKIASTPTYLQILKLHKSQASEILDHRC